MSSLSYGQRKISSREPPPRGVKGAAQITVFEDSTGSGTYDKHKVVIDGLNIAVNLADDRPRLGKLRQTLRSRKENSVLMDAPHFARQIESAYRATWRKWCRDQPS